MKALIEEFMALEQCPGDAAMRIIAVVAAALGFQSVAGLSELLEYHPGETIAEPGAR